MCTRSGPSATQRVMRNEEIELEKQSTKREVLRSDQVSVHTQGLCPFRYHELQLIARVSFFLVFVVLKRYMNGCIILI